MKTFLIFVGLSLILNSALSYTYEFNEIGTITRAVGHDGGALYYESSASILGSSNFVIKHSANGDYYWSSDDLYYINDENNLVPIPFNGISIDSNDSGTDYFILTSNEVLFSRRNGNNLQNWNHLNRSHNAYSEVIGPSGKILKNDYSNSSSSKLIIGNIHNHATIYNNTLNIFTDSAGWNIIESVNGDNIEISNRLSRYSFTSGSKRYFYKLNPNYNYWDEDGMTPAYISEGEINLGTVYYISDWDAMTGEAFGNNITNEVSFKYITLNGKFIEIEQYGPSSIWDLGSMYNTTESKHYFISDVGLIELETTNLDTKFFNTYNNSFVKKEEDLLKIYSINDQSGVITQIGQSLNYTGNVTAVDLSNDGTDLSFHNEGNRVFYKLINSSWILINSANLPYASNSYNSKNLDLYIHAENEDGHSGLSTAVYKIYKKFPHLDTDEDGIYDHLDAFINDPNEWLDTDGDDVGNNADLDDDNDSYLDANDAFPLDASEWLDTDGDDVGNNADLDDDNDSYLDANDAFPLDASEWLDTDGDDVGNNADLDDDGDAILDLKELEIGTDPLIPGNHNALINSLYTLDSIRDIKLDSKLIEVTGNQATLQLQMEESSDLQTWEDKGDPATMTIPADTDTKFFRFKMAE